MWQLTILREVNLMADKLSEQIEKEQERQERRVERLEATAEEVRRTNSLRRRQERPHTYKHGAGDLRKK